MTNFIKIYFIVCFMILTIHIVPDNISDHIRHLYPDKMFSANYIIATNLDSKCTSLAPTTVRINYHSLFALEENKFNVPARKV